MPEFHHIAGAPIPVDPHCQTPKAEGWMMLAVDAPIGAALVARRWS